MYEISNRAKLVYLIDCVLINYQLSVRKYILIFNTVTVFTGIKITRCRKTSINSMFKRNFRQVNSLIVVLKLSIIKCARRRVFHTGIFFVRLDQRFSPAIWYLL